MVSVCTNRFGSTPQIMSDADLSQNAETSATNLGVDEVRSESWFDEEDSDEEDVSFKEYDITASPNDFNIKTIVDFVTRGAFVIPGFQRNYVWDIQRASKLIESLLIGLPIPQIFLYEEKRNSFLVVDGQQRLMSVYYFIKGRFPRREKRGALRRMLDENPVLPASIMSDDAYFTKFNLSLKAKDGRKTSRFHGKNYDTLEDYQTSLDLRTIRNIVIKQNSPNEDNDTSVFEIFNRLNTGGVNLRPQEIRSSLYHSKFTEMLHRECGAWTGRRAVAGRVERLTSHRCSRVPACRSRPTPIAGTISRSRDTGPRTRPLTTRPCASAAARQPHGLVH